MPRGAVRRRQTVFSGERIATSRLPANGSLIATSLIIVAVGAWLTVSPLTDTLEFVRLLPLCWLLLAIMLVGYVILNQVVKTKFVRRFG